MRKHTLEDVARVLRERSVGAESGCRLWTGPKVPKGYGAFSNRFGTAHRAAYIAAHGEIPGGMHVLHRCDTPACVNPDHLWLGTNADNIEDKERKGRAGKKLNTDAVKEIKGMIAQGNSQASIAKLFGVNPSCISEISTGKAWRFVEAGGR